MADEPKSTDAFRPQDPHIPGVTDNPRRAKDAAKLAKQAKRAQQKASAGPSILASPKLWGTVIVVIVAVAGASYGVQWWNRDRELHDLENPHVVAGKTDLADPNITATAGLPFGPGPIATTDELADTWSSKRFVFRPPQTANDIPAIVIKLPKDTYVGVELREPFGTCELKYVTSLSELETDYHLQTDHPMVADPCSHAVFDLTQTAAGPNGTVRGAVVAGAAVRPPIAVQMQVKGKDIVAVKIEE
jgi:hypothetical protein